MGKALVIIGTSRCDGETSKSVDVLNQGFGADILNLSDYQIGFYDYQHENEKDGFYDISMRMIDYSTIVFATPVYWYAMSAQMKVFIDRFSDLITVRKQDGRALANKSTYLIANGTGERIPDNFDLPFRDTSNYFDMKYRGHHYVYTGSDKILRSSTWSAIGEFREGIIEG